MTRKHGFLVRQGDALERLADVKRIAFDKTGTLTFGKPEVIAVKVERDAFSEKELYYYAAAAEKMSEHPLGKAVVRCYHKEFAEQLPKAIEFCMKPGMGIAARVHEKEVLAGNEVLLCEHNITITGSLRKNAEEYLQKGSTVIYVAIENRLAGFIALSDTLKPESGHMIDTLKTIGIKPILLTGDNENAAKAIAKQLHVEDLKANCLPEDKLTVIEAYQSAGEPVCMIGDGVNDAPALKKADVGIAMGGVGSDIAVDAADIALVDDKVEELPHLLALSKRMMVTIKWNLTFSMTLNFIAIALAITGILNPVVGALVHNAGSVLVIANSALLLKWKRKKWFLE